MSRFGRLFLLLAAVGAVLAASRQAPAASARPNIVYILADDLGSADLGFQGSHIATPHLDQLARDGVRLDQFYTLPLCTPTRAALLTGRYPIRYGLQQGVIRAPACYGLPLTERTLPQELRAAGYRTAMVGKWHLGHHEPEYLPEQRGFDHFYGFYTATIDYFTHFFCGGLDWHRNGASVEEAGYITNLFAREAVQLINQHDRRRPLFLYLAFHAPHTPLLAPQAYLDRYRHIADPNRRAYAAMVTCMDDAIGRVRLALSQRGMAGNTFIVFHSDNGGAVDYGASNSPLRGQKAELTEGGVRVPCIATWPGRLPSGSRVTNPAHVVDWSPTLLRLAGATPPPNLDGRDLWPALLGSSVPVHDEILLNIQAEGAALRRGTFKLIRTPSQTGPAYSLFNLARDPAEARNLATARPDVVATLRARLEAWEARAVPPLRREDPEMEIPPIWGEPTPGPTLVPPGALRAAPAPGGATIVLSWRDNALSETGFQVERRTKVGGAATITNVPGRNVTGWKDTRVDRGGTYIYRVRARNCYKYGEFSAPVTFTLAP